jgi:hypothetical protein
LEIHTHIRSVFALAVIGCIAGSVAVVTCQSGSAAAKPAIRACSLLTKELVSKITPYDEEQKRLVFTIPPQEDSVGASGSACEYGGIHLQIDPFPWTTVEKVGDKTWVAVPQVGDAAYFRDNRGDYAELAAHVGARVVTIQMSIPTGRTADSIKPNVVALANAVLPSLK